MAGRADQGREVVYDAVLYGLGAVLGELARTPVGARLAEELHMGFGRHMADYLHQKGIRYERDGTPEEVVSSVVRVFLESLDFADLEKTEPTEDRGVHGVWRGIVGLAAYTELLRKYPDPFLSCPLNAVIRYELGRAGHTLKVHGATADPEAGLLESWEEVLPGKTEFLGADE
jgi:hypothetical protein